ncbi:MAG TPA: trypsin-like peptidase domain-containing protein [Pyrinomonadaceae bacterium]|nr:trypsin-like peptidase domain-containing protein [Pyrinomonadaceae bacterium]
MQTPPGADEQPETPSDLSGHYKKLLRQGTPVGGGVEGVGDAADAEPDLSNGGIKDRLDETRTQLKRIIDQHLGGTAELHDIAERIVVDADEALRVLRDEDEHLLGTRRNLLDSLEAIIRTDGSRPSFMIRNGEVDRSTSPVGAWADTLDASSNMLRDAISCVGRIDSPSAPQGFEGTGFLIQDDLIITNRHVLQAIGRRNDDGVWTLSEGAAIDFGHEFRARETVGRRALRGVLFAGAKPILETAPVDHTKLDLALLELEPAAADERPRATLSLDVAGDWAQPDLSLFTLGYPANPGFGLYAPTLLEQLFQTTFGYKRLAPGLVIKPQVKVHTWTFAHDATTLGGNSGSVLLVVGREHAAAGLHYGGRRGDPRENWGHVLGLVLDQTDGRSDTTLRQHLRQRGVRFIDRVSAGQPGH